MKILFSRKKKSVFFIFFVTVLLLYSSSLFGSFVSDDITTIRDNHLIGNFSWVVSQHFTVLRPLFYFGIYYLFGLNPFFYHLLNVVFHTGTVCVLYLLLLEMGMRKRIAFIACLLFAIHPIATESVSWISGGPYPQYAFFLLCSFLLFIKKKDRVSTGFAVFLYFLSLISSFMALVFPLLLFVYCSIFNPTKKYFQKIIFFLIPFVIFLIYYVSALQTRIATIQMGNHQSNMVSPLLYIHVAITRYLQLLIWPQGLTLYHAEVLIGHAQYIFSFIPFIIFLITLCVSYQKNKTIFFWELFFIITLLPTLTPFKISWVVAERYVYLGSIGFFVIAAIGFDILLQKKSYKNMILGVLAVIIFFLMCRTIIRNLDWRDQDSLWIATNKTTPNSAQNHNNLGDMYARHGNLNQAVYEFKKAIELLPDYADAYHNLGLTYIDLKEYNKARDNFIKSSQLNPNLWQSYQNLAAIYFQQKKYDQALIAIQKAIKINPYNQQLRQNLRVIQMHQK